MSKEPGNKLVTGKDKLPFSNSPIQKGTPTYGDSKDRLKKGLLMFPEIATSKVYI